MLATAAVREAADAPSPRGERRCGLPAGCWTAGGGAALRRRAVAHAAGRRHQGDLGGGSLELVRRRAAGRELATLPLGPLRLLGDRPRRQGHRRLIDEALDGLPGCPRAAAASSRSAALAALAHFHRELEPSAEGHPRLRHGAGRAGKPGAGDVAPDQGFLSRIKNVSSRGSRPCRWRRWSCAGCCAAASGGGGLLAWPARRLALQPATAGERREGSAAGGGARRHPAGSPPATSTRPCLVRARSSRRRRRRAGCARRSALLGHRLAGHPDCRPLGPAPDPAVALPGGRPPPGRHRPGRPALRRHRGDGRLPPAAGGRRPGGPRSWAWPRLAYTLSDGTVEVRHSCLYWSKGGRGCTCRKTGRCPRATWWSGAWPSWSSSGRA